MEKLNYGSAILAGFDYVLTHFDNSFVMGQGLWSPWYVGNSMTDLDKKFGVERVIDTPVSESACTGVAVGASLAGMRPIIVHPRIDFMLYAMDAIVNQAAKWSSMTGGQASASVTIRGIINRGGEQGAQHSQALHAWFAHIPGLRVVMPATVADARDLLIASVLSPDPVVYIDDRWLYDQTATLPSVKRIDLKDVQPQILLHGKNLTIVSSGFMTRLALDVAHELKKIKGVTAQVIDLRVLNPLNPDIIVESVAQTKNLLVLDGGWKNCGMAGEVIATVVERLQSGDLNHAPKRICLPDSPAPSSRVLEESYYPNMKKILDAAQALL